MSWEIRLIHAVIGIIRRDGKLLIAERPQGKSYPGYWEFPGGKIEPNELHLTALQRELNEELGISNIQADFWYEFTYIYPDQSVHLELWLVNDYCGEPEGIEGQRISWVTLDEMMKRHLIDGMWPIIDKLKELMFARKAI